MGNVKKCPLKPGPDRLCEGEDCQLWWKCREPWEVVIIPSVWDNEWDNETYDPHITTTCSYDGDIYAMSSSD